MGRPDGLWNTGEGGISAAKDVLNESFRLAVLQHYRITMKTKETILWKMLPDTLWTNNAPFVSCACINIHLRARRRILWHQKLLRVSHHLVH
jgi:hypothetical protein